MNPIISALIQAIEKAFAGVSLGTGVALLEADVIDAYGGMEERLKAREQNEKTDWKLIPDNLIERNPHALCFMDAQGLRFHLPAYMRFSLRHFQDCKTISSEVAAYRLTDPKTYSALRPILTEAQIEVILEFLTACIQLEIDDGEDIAFAIRFWSGDETAIQESILSKLSPREIERMFGRKEEIPESSRRPWWKFW